MVKNLYTKVRKKKSTRKLHRAAAKTWFPKDLDDAGEKKNRRRTLGAEFLYQTSGVLPAEQKKQVAGGPTENSGPITCVVDRSKKTSSLKEPIQHFPIDSGT